MLWLKRENTLETLQERHRGVQNAVSGKLGGERESQAGFQEEEEGVEEGQLVLRARVGPGIRAELRAIQAQGEVGGEGVVNTDLSLGQNVKNQIDVSLWLVSLGAQGEAGWVAPWPWPTLPQHDLVKAHTHSRQ